MASESNLTSGPSSAGRRLRDQVKKDFDENRTIFILHVVGIALGVVGLAFEIASPALHAWHAAPIPTGDLTPPLPKVLGLNFVLKICALLLVQWTIARVQAAVQITLSGGDGSFWVIAGILVSLIAAWLSIINVQWIGNADRSAAVISSANMMALLCWIIALLMSILLVISEFSDPDIAGYGVVWVGSYVICFIIISIVAWAP
jgi:hypothetical protein